MRRGRPKSASAAPPAPATEQHPGIEAWLYDGSGTDRAIGLDAIAGTELPAQQLLWIDACATDRQTVSIIEAKVSLAPDAVDWLLAPGRALSLDNYGDYFALSILAMAKETEAMQAIQSVRVVILVGKSWLVSIHDGPVAFITGFREQDKGETDIGLLSPALLLSALLDWHLSGFLNQISGIETAADQLDAAILGGMETRAVLAKMVKIRKRISALRRMLADQRSAIYGLSRPDFALLTGKAAGPQLEQIAARFDRAIDEVERSRDVIVGSFDLFTSLTAQSTNELVKGLTIVTVVIGLCGAVAGVLGMNFELPFFKTGTGGFLGVLAGMALMTALTLGWARWRKWL